MITKYDELRPFSHAFEDASVFALAERTIAWSRANGLFDPSGHIREVVVAAVFASCCAPARATAHNLDIAARFVLTFLSIDDAEPAEVRRLLPAPERWGLAAYLPALRAWLEEFDELRTCVPAAARALATSFDDYLAARRHEVDVDRATITFEDAWSLRTRTIFNAPYVAHWLVSLDLYDASFESDLALACQRLATEIIFVLNDLTSVDKDGADGGVSADLSIVAIHRRDTGASLDRAVAHFTDLHNAMVRRYRALAHDAATSGPAKLGRYVELLTAVVTGNRRAHELTLRTRYRARVAGILAQLSTID
jgi:hypothetical protein